MFRNLQLGFFATAILLFRSAEIVCAQDYCGHRGDYNGGGSGPAKGSFFGYRPGYGWGCHSEQLEAGPKPKRFLDATGRWTGDGVDTMATNPPPWKRGQ